MRPRIAIAACLTIAACRADDDVSFRSIEPVCIEDGDDLPAGAWECSEPLTLDCNDASVPDEIYVLLGDGECGMVALQDVPGPFPPGEYDVSIVDDNTDLAVCTTQLTVTDAVAPVVETEQLSMWPPNHKLHSFALADCMTVVDCDENWTAAIDWVTSDEPDDDNGDGHTAGDIVLVASDAVDLRSERQGGSNGRVYTVGFTVTDGSGNATAAECMVVVDHDNGKKGAAIDDGEAYRVEP